MGFIGIQIGANPYVRKQIMIAANILKDALDMSRIHIEGIFFS